MLVHKAVCRQPYAKNPVFDQELIFAVILFARSHELQIYIAND